MKSLLNKLLHPNIALYILICIVGYTSVIITLTLKYDNTVFGYISYILSFYALILTILKVPTLYKIIYKKLDNMKYTNKFLHEEDFRNDIYAQYKTDGEHHAVPADGHRPRNHIRIKSPRNEI